MLADQAFAWVLVVSVALCVGFGALSFGGALWKFVFRTISGAAITFAFLGVVLLTVPKWSEIALEAGVVKMRIAELEEENGTLRVALADAQEEQWTALTSKVQVWQPVQAGEVANMIQSGVSGPYSWDQAVSILRDQGIEIVELVSAEDVRGSTASDVLLGGFEADALEVLLHNKRGLIEGIQN